MDALTPVPPVPCNTNSCTGIMTAPAESSLGSFMFRCSRCEQSVTVRADGYDSQTVLPRLYPSDPARWPARMHQEYADYELQQREFFLRLRVAAGFMDAREAERILDSTRAEVTRYKAEHAVAPTTPWWRRVRAWLS